MSRRQTFVVEPNQKNVTPYRFLCRMLGAPSGVVRSLIADGHVTVDGTEDALNRPLRAGNVVDVEWPAELEQRARSGGPRRPIEILYEDDRVIVVDKPAGVPVVPERRRWKKTVVDLLPASALRGGRPKVVHRLDKHTSGALLLARDRDTKRELCRAFMDREVHKEYVALVRGRFPEEEGEIDAPLTKDRRHALRMVVAKDRERGKPSLTRFRVEERLDGYTWLRLQPVTGRTHQLRVHLAHLGFPILGDELYGARPHVFLSELKLSYRPKPGRPEKPILDRVALHCRRLELASPAPESPPIRVEAPLADDLSVLKRHLDRWRPDRS
ncbi:MAG: RluA family pseudouridine synthase [Planctomycetota bacterium JB042]